MIPRELRLTFGRYWILSCFPLALILQPSVSITNGNGGLNKKPDRSDDDLISQFLGSSKTNDLSVSDSGKVTKCSKCVKYFECQNDGKGQPGGFKPLPQQALEALGISDADFLGILDIRQNFNTCPHYFDACCEDLKPTTSETIAPEVHPTSPDLPSEQNDEKPKVYLKSLADWSHSSCGLRNDHGLGFHIVGGKDGESQFGEFPWTIAVLHENFSRNVFLCGGSLIHPSVVLTAAHCVSTYGNSESGKTLKIRAGEWDTQTVDEPLPHQDRYVKQTIFHEQMARKGLYNDIALLILDKPVTLAPNIDTICLPSSEQEPSTFDGQSCFSAGWGKDKFGEEGIYQDIMKKVQLTIVPRHECELQLRQTRLSDAFRLHESFVCASPGESSHKDVCQGDGGSPLMCKSLNTKNYIQLGIVSWGIGCSANIPGVYVNVHKFVPWITTKMNDNGFSLKYCTV